ncbi:MAG: bifunctional diaminohydroxyphosphoribosylaminopyrimidine deaminase/5-amino-6-(5-phosphoribosylamino)uracil reductase RibD [Gammaproteobacteria bacterium]|nr:bifunctional diaminohydroxyphosphoribosylaminopyrimidine deaminase/5-amino-6-(5-phosphoribosylamino)uracil reductase RibD [Gammaproteobacteria bacterium]
MSHALQLAQRGLYSTDPNPRVGCVLVKDGVVAGSGWHAVAGGPHAEIHALQNAGTQARGATAYVTLEPCCHHGKTPPCTDALIAAGVVRVVAAMTDPNPKVGGKGLQQLRDAGIEVESGLLESQALALNPGFVQRMRSGRPWVRCKSALSLDGKTALANGRSQWITGDAARLDVQRWRARSSAIVTGIGTVLADDPSLTVRIDTGQKPVRQPLRVVLDRQLRMAPTAKLLVQPGRTLIFTTANDSQKAAALQRSNVQVVTLPELQLDVMLARLAQEQCNEVWVEAGAALSGALLQAGLVDELILYVAPKLLGDTARGLFQLPSFSALADAVSLELTDVRMVGEDVRIIAKLGTRTSSPPE